MACGFLSLRDEALKNVADPVRVYRVVAGAAITPPARRRMRLVLATGTAVALVLGLAGWLASSRQRAAIPRSRRCRSRPPTRQPPRRRRRTRSRASNTARSCISQEDCHYEQPGRVAGTVERLATIAGIPNRGDIHLPRKPAEVTSAYPRPTPLPGWPSIDEAEPTGVIECVERPPWSGFTFDEDRHRSRGDIPPR